MFAVLESLVNGITREEVLQVYRYIISSYNFNATDIRLYLIFHGSKAFKVLFGHRKACRLNGGNGKIEPGFYGNSRWVAKASDALYQL